MTRNTTVNSPRDCLRIASREHALHCQRQAMWRLFLLHLILLCGCAQNGPMKRLNDDVLGALVWNDRTDAWECSPQLASGHRVEISLIPLTSDLTPIINRARSFVQRFSEEDARLRKAAAQTLLDTHNESWNDGDKIGEETFTRRMWLNGVFFWDDRAEAYYFDGGLFGGHMIVVPCNDDGTIEDAYIAG